MLAWYRALPESFRMVGTAIIGASIGFLTYQLIYSLNVFALFPFWDGGKLPRASSSWLLSYLIGIARQHGLHRFLTYNDRASPYWKSLKRAYMMYSGSFLIGGALDYLLADFFHLNHQLVWLICLFTTAGISFLFLRDFVFKVE